MKACPNGHTSFAKDAKFCSECGAELVEQVDPIVTTIALQRDKDDNHELADRMGLDAAAARSFSYTGVEVTCSVSIDPQSGVVYLLAIHDGKGNEIKLERPVVI